MAKEGMPRINKAINTDLKVIETTPGDVNEAHRMIPLIECHKTNTEIKADTVVGDSKYGTIENFLACRDLGINAQSPDLRQSGGKTDRETQDIFRRPIHI